MKGNIFSFHKKRNRFRSTPASSIEHNVIAGHEYLQDMTAVEMLKGREGEMSDPRSTFKAGKRIVDSVENNAMNTLNHPRDSLPHDERRSDASSVLHYEGQRAVGSLEKNALDAIREREVSWGTSVLNDEQNTDQTVGIKKTSTTGGKSDHLEISPGKTVIS